MAYSEKLLDHYENPRNVGTLDKDDDSVGTGLVGAPACLHPDTLIAVADGRQYVSIKQLAEEGKDGFNETWGQLEKKYKGVELFSENTFGSVARGLRRQKNNQAIVKVYEIWVEKYPESSNAHFNLGKAYVAIEETKLAKKEFKKALAIDPENKAAEEELSKLN